VSDVAEKQTLKIIDDVLSPEQWININFKGKEPVKVFLQIPKIVQLILKAEGKDVYEFHTKWDVTDDPTTFYGSWRGGRTEDRWSKTYVYAIGQGAQGKDGLGWLTIWLRGEIETSYDYTNFIQRNLWWFYNMRFYYKQRRAYLEQGKDFIYMIRDEMRMKLGIQPNMG